jgi:hypothetical protein
MNEFGKGAPESVRGEYELKDGERLADPYALLPEGFKQKFEVVDGKNAPVTVGEKIVIYEDLGNSSASEIAGKLPSPLWK